MKNRYQLFKTSEKGEIAVMAAILIPTVLLVFLFLVSKMDLYGVKSEIKYYMELSSKVATDTAVVMEDANGNNVCVILNDKDIQRNNTWQQTTDTLYNNLANPNNHSIKLGEEINITAVSTADAYNAWNWNKEEQRFERPSSMRDLNQYFQQGQVSLIVTGTFKPAYLPIPDFWSGYHFRIAVSASCLS